MPKSEKVSSDGFLEWLEETSGPAKKLKFAERAQYLAAQSAGGVAWDAICNLKKLIRSLPEAKREVFEVELNVLVKALYTELNEYKFLEKKKAVIGNNNASKYPEQVVRQALNKFDSLTHIKSKKQRAIITASSLEKPRPSWQSIIGWVEKRIPKASK